MNGRHEKAERTVSGSAYRRLLKLADGNGLLRDGRTNLDTHRSDGEDFLEISVWTLNGILQDAYRMGYADAEAELKKGGGR